MCILPALVFLLSTVVIVADLVMIMMILLLLVLHSVKHSTVARRRRHVLALLLGWQRKVQCGSIEMETLQSGTLEPGTGHSIASWWTGRGQPCRLPQRRI